MPVLDLPAPPWIVGHRGAAEEAPENSLEGLLLAVDQGADLVEVDLRLSADGELVLFHDADLERLAGSASKVEELTVEELQRFDLAGTTIPTLVEALGALPVDFPFNLELKRSSADPAILVATLVAVAGERDNVLVSSFDLDLLAAVGAAAPGIALAPLAKHGPGKLVEAARELSAFSLHCHRRIASAELVAAARSFGWPVLAYTVNDRETASELLARGVAGLFTDAPGRLRRELEEPG